VNLTHSRPVLLLAVALLLPVPAFEVRGAGLQPGKSPVQPQLSILEAIKHLGDLDYTKRTRAAASLRRRAPA
jgi:hypothetical protein